MVDDSNSKPDGYYGQGRADVVAELPHPIGRVLDVGCGEGAVGGSLRAAGAAEVVGIEIVPDAAAIAAQQLDQVAVGAIEDVLGRGEITGPFDTICCYDVLEHLAYPNEVLSQLRELAADGGRLHISIPNARHFSLMRDLVFKGTFGYTDFGHRDNTHLRWYTRRDLIALVQDAGWNVQWVRSADFRGRDRQFDKVTFGRTREFITLQWHLLATAS